MTEDTVADVFEPIDMSMLLPWVWIIWTWKGSKKGNVHA